MFISSPNFLKESSIIILMALVKIHFLFFVVVDHYTCIGATALDLDFVVGILFMILIAWIGQNKSGLA